MRIFCPHEKAIVIDYYGVLFHSWCDYGINNCNTCTKRTNFISNVSINENRAIEQAWLLKQEENKNG